jgi:hypothetical protein
MPLMKDLHFAVYGSKKLIRGFCENCERWALVIGGISQCCDSLVQCDELVLPQHRMCETSKRRSLSVGQREDILERQSFSCFYCCHYFDIVVKRKGKTFALRPHFDHVVPFVYCGDSNEKNLVATCHLCNLWKSDRVFNSLEEIQAYLKEKWEREVVVTDEVSVRIGARWRG